MPPLIAFAGIFAATALATSAIPQPGQLKTFKDWVVGCDNGGNCEAVSLVPKQGGSYDDWDGPITISRSAGAEDALKIRVLFQSTDIDRYQMTVDGQLVDTGPIVEGDYPIEIVGEDAKKVAEAVKRGNKLKISGPAGENLTQISLAGSSAALRYIDAQQKRAGTRTALVAKGRKNFAPLSSATPVYAVDQWEKSEMTPEAGELVALVENSACKEDRFGVTEDRAYPMGKRDGTFRALVLVSCGSGAYNFSSAAYIGEYEEGGRGTKGWTFEPAKFDMPPGWGGDGGPPLLVNSYWDETDQILGSYAKGRGLGDCGSSERYVWDGNMFRLIEASSMNECRGAYQWITTWRARYNKVDGRLEQAAAVN